MLSSEPLPRLRKLHRLGLLDTTSGDAFDAITRVAARHFGVPISLISLVDDYRQWFKSRVGLDVRETPRDQAFCAETILSSDVMLVPDALADPRFANNPLVRGDPAIRFYAGAPLVTPDGLALGSLCIIDRKPRDLSIEDQDVLRDLATLVMSQVTLLHAVEHIDPVTRMPNRAQFMLDVDNACRNEDQKTMVLIESISLEAASTLVQAFGVPFVDAVVRSVAAIIDERVGAQCRVYHVGTGRFLFSIRQRGKDMIGLLVDSIIQILRAELVCNGIPITLSTCAGIVPDLCDGHPSGELLSMAFSAVHDARMEDHHVALYRPEADASWRRSTRLITLIPRALSEDDFHLVFQPRIDLASGRCVGVEALLRWTHPDLGVVSPAEFIPLVEQTGLIHPVGNWVIRAALRQAGVWRRAGVELIVSINLSAENLAEADLVERIAAGLRREGVDAFMVELEVTEGARLYNSQVAQQRLSELAALGLRIAIDDFGTGYSNLTYLRSLPATILKIDQSLIRTLAADEASRIIVHSTLDMAHKLGYRVVVEGVEDAATLQCMARWGCDEVQGFHISMGMAPLLVPEWVKAFNNATNCSFGTTIEKE